MRILYITLGCAKNEVDSAAMANRLSTAGYLLSDDPQCADVLILNTCSFIQSATEESIEAILELAELERVQEGSAHLVVTGCLPVRYEGELEDELPEVSRFVPCKEEEHIVAIVDKLLGVERIGDGSRHLHSPAVEEGLVSAYLKISDGCDRFCSYCTIPLIRGRYHSYTYDFIASEVQRLVSYGIREIVLIAQDTGRWGADFPQPMTLARLLEALAESFPDTWFRIMYLQPEGVSDELLDVMLRHDNICRYLDIPFQHCKSTLLARMNRSGSYEEYISLIAHMRERVPGLALRTTLMVGFPGETDEDFDALCSFVEAAELDYVGIFAYSQEEGTRAARMSNQVDEDEKLYRVQRLRDCADSVSSRVIAERKGKSMKVLVCGCEEDGQWYGRTQFQAPDVDGVTFVDAGERGEFIDVRITDTLMYEMEGELEQ